MKKIKMFNFLKKRKTQRKVQKDAGRSMVEMLGVLAIIGVLSIGGIAGYTMAMNHHKVNRILDIASKLSILSQSQYEASSKNEYEVGNARNNMYVAMGLDQNGSSDTYEVTFFVWPENGGNVYLSSRNQSITHTLDSMGYPQERQGLYRVVNAD